MAGVLSHVVVVILNVLVILLLVLVVGSSSMSIGNNNGCSYIPDVFLNHEVRIKTSVLILIS